MPWAQVLAVAAGAALGALLRWTAGVWLNAQWSGFPLGTLLVNCVGGLLIGAALVWFDRSPNEVLRLLLITGFLGGLTTFSAFSGESLSLIQRGEYAMALAHTLVHVVGSLVCAAAGFRLMRAWLA
ncbi:MAG: fluoride efflux transporter CrcB [Rhizobacter sp.]|nr:fluoride efflux transporter CrcB [Rhizobacter sp.]